jgi:tRNA pseudouridine38-40 synthase
VRAGSSGGQAGLTHLKTFKLTIAYDGAGFVGWQRQTNGPSIQGLLEEILSELDNRDVAVAGASRTDAGVHALKQVASLTLERTIDAAALVRALNAKLPEAIRVVDAAEVAAAFHARFDSRAKTYRYRIWNAEVMSPFERGRAWHVPAPRLDVEAMDQAARLFEGHHDFAAFQAVGASAQSTERELFSSRVLAPAGPLITYEVRGAGFLRHMVRTLAGTLVEVGRGRQTTAWASEVVASRDRSKAGRTAPAEGLFLVEIEYQP